MLVFQYNDMFQDIYEKAAEKYPEIKNIVIVVNTHCTEGGVSVGKGIGENEGQFLISCCGSNDNLSYVLSGFALGLAMVIFDLKYGEFDYATMSEEQKTEFDDMFHGFYSDSERVTNLNIHYDSNEV